MRWVETGVYNRLEWQTLINQRFHQITQTSYISLYLFISVGSLRNLFICLWSSAADCAAVHTVFAEQRLAFLILMCDVLPLWMCCYCLYQEDGWKSGNQEWGTSVVLIFVWDQMRSTKWKFGQIFLFDLWMPWVHSHPTHERLICLSSISLTDLEWLEVLAVDQLIFFSNIMLIFFFLKMLMKQTEPDSVWTSRNW